MIHARVPRLAGAVVLSAIVPLGVVSLASGAVASRGLIAAPVRPTVPQVQQRIEALNHQAEQAAENYNAAQERLRGLAVRTNAAKQRAALQRKRVEAARRNLGRLAAEVYKSGGSSSLALLLSDDPDAVLALHGTVTAVGDRLNDAVQQLKRQQKLLDDDLADIAAQRRRVTETQASLRASRKRVEERLAAARTELNRLRADERAQLVRASRTASRRSLSQVLGRQVSDRPTCTEAGVNIPGGRVGKVISYACAQLGDPYLWGGAGPDRFDCSGLSQQAWKQAGVSLPHNAAMQSKYGRTVSADDLQPGDLVFFYQPISHMGIYVGDGLMIAAPQTGDVVKIQPVRYQKLTTAVRL